MPSRLNLTPGTRVRFQRLRDAKLFAGWAMSLTEQQVQIRAPAGMAVEVNDLFMVEVFGHSKNLQFQARLSVVHEEAYQLEVVGPMRESQAQESVRVAVPDYPCTLSWESQQVRALAADISPSGLGLRSEQEVPRGTKVALEVRLPAGSIQCDGEVRYCRSTKLDDAPYRIGVLITYIDRINRARWWAQFESLAA